MRHLTNKEWLDLGEKLHGHRRFREWEFQCPVCGHVQSIDAVLERADTFKSQLTAQEVGNWIFFSCEGRVHKGTGCDYTQGGLFTIGTQVVESIDDPTNTVAAFYYASDPDRQAPCKPGAETFL